MDWSQSPRILLVWPDRGKVLRNRLDLVLLERYCTAHGSQLALLTSNTEVIYQAEEAGIPIFQSRKAAQLQPWGKSFREFERKEITQKAGEYRDIDSIKKSESSITVSFPTWVRILIFTIAILAVLAIAGLLLPSAVITIPEEGITKRLIVPVKADPEMDFVNISGIIPARKLMLKIDGEKSRPASGNISIPDEIAAGEVIFTNLSEFSITIPDNSILSTSTEDPVLFITLESGSTPQGIGEQVAVKIRALEGGSRGNVSADQINRINQAFGADLTVTNPAPLSGGTDIDVTAPTQADRTFLTSSLMTEIEQKALEDFQGLISEGDVLFSSSLNVVEIENESSAPDPGLAGEKITLSKRVKYEIWYAAEEDINFLADQIITAQYRDRNFEFIPGSLSIDYERTTVSMSEWILNIKWEERKLINSFEIIQLALGKDVNDAQDLIQESLKSTKTPEISIKPDWWFRLPILPFRIKLINNGVSNK